MSKGDGNRAEGDDSEDGSDDEDEDEEGGFEDLETGEKHGGGAESPKANAEPEDMETERENNARRKEELKLRFEEEDREGFKNDKAIARREAEEGFDEDEWYDAQKALLKKQQDINKAEYEQLDEHQRTAVEGFRAGSYAKMVASRPSLHSISRPRCPLSSEGSRLSKGGLVSSRRALNAIDGTRKSSSPEIVS